MRWFRRDRKKEKDMPPTARDPELERIRRDTQTLRDIGSALAEAKSQVRETVPPDADNGRHEQR